MDAKWGTGALVLLALLLAVRLFNHAQSVEHIKDGQKLRFTAIMREEPQIINGRQQFNVKTTQNQRIRIITGLNPQLQYGDKIAIDGTVKASEKDGRTFFTMLFPDLQIAPNEQNIISQFAVAVRQRAGELFNNSLPPVSASLLLGIVFGGDQDMPKEFMDALRISGVVHVIAASGMNVTFVTAALLGILGAIFRRQGAITIAVIGVLFYMVLAGFEPSIVRATVMSIIAFSASLMGRQNFAFGSLFLTAFLMLFVTPPLLEDVGFQLSFLATLGILSIKPFLPLGKNKFIADDIGTTISAQIATLPILLAVFGQYGVFSVLVNALILWTVPLLMVIGSTGFLLGVIFEPLGKIVLFSAIPILFYFEKMVTYFGGLGGVITIPQVSNAVWIGYYFLVTAAVLYRHKSTATKKKAIDVGPHP